MRRACPEFGISTDLSVAGWPAGARYRSTAPPLPGTPMITVSEVEVAIGVSLADLHAA
jgi:hypothetical protein